MQPADPSSDPIAATRHEVERLLGLCLLQLQAYEMRLKDIVARHDLSARIDQIGEVRAKRQRKAHGKTMGGLISDLLDTFLVAKGRKGGAPERNDAPSVAARMQIVLSEEDMTKTAADLRDLVDLRNTLVHHFLEGHDLLTTEGCTRAVDDLNAALARIALARNALMSWKTDLDQMQSAMIQYMQTPEFHDALASRMKKR